MSPDGTEQAAPVDVGIIAEAVASAPPVDPGTATAEPPVATGQATEPIAEGQPAGDSPSRDDAARAADEADLAQYPESVREEFRAFTPEKRKALYEHAEARVSERITRERERNDKLEADRKAREEQDRAVVAQLGKIVGHEAQTIELAEGVTLKLPAYDEMMRLSQTQTGRDRLEDEYGIDERMGLLLKYLWDQNAQAFKGSRDHMRNLAHYDLDQGMRASFREVGLDPDEYLNTAKSAEEIVPAVVKKLRADHEAALAKQKADYEGQLGLRDANAEGLRARAVAGSARELPTGGRTAGSDVMTLERFRALPLADRKRMRSENPALVDRLYAQGALPTV